MKNLQIVCEAKVHLTESKNESQNPTGLIEARATTWGAREGEDGRKFNYQPEGFMEWAEAFSKEGKPMPMFLNHNDMGMPVGEWNEVMFDDEGMSAKGKLFLETSGGADIYHILKESPSLFGGVSVGAYAEEAQMVDVDGNPIDEKTPMGDAMDSYFQITKGGLREISVVMYPNNTKAEIQKLECVDAEGHLNPRTVEEALRDAGLSKKHASTASSFFKNLFEQHIVAKKAIEGTPNQSDSDAVAVETKAEELLKAFELRELAKALEKRINK